MKIQNFDRQTLKSLRAEMEAVLAKYGNKAGVEFDIGNISFSDAEANIKVSAKVKGAKTQTDEILEMACKSLNIKKRVNAKGDKLIALKSRSPRYPFVYEAANGKQCKCTRDMAREMFS